MLNKATLKYNKEPKKCINMYDAIFQRTNLKLLSDITGSNDISIFFFFKRTDYCCIQYSSHYRNRTRNIS